MIHRALTIAGSDSGGGAGIQQDLKTFGALGVWGTSAITSITAQNTLGVEGRFDLSPEAIEAQIRAVMSDIGADAAKTGMLASAKIVEAVARAVADHGITPLVVDPVMVATSGGLLLDTDAVVTLRDELLPRATIVTPNVAEAAALSGFEVTDAASILEAAHAIRACGTAVVIVTGGDLPAEESVDLLLDAEGELELRAPRLAIGAAHGSGCMFSAALAAGLAQGMEVRVAARLAKEFTHRGIANAVSVGKGAAVHPGPGTFAP